jgi:hypothetical protein
LHHISSSSLACITRLVKLITFSNNAGHEYHARRIFFTIIYLLQNDLLQPPHEVLKEWHVLLSYLHICEVYYLAPISKILLFHYEWLYILIYINSLTLFNYIGCIWNNIASIVWLGIPTGSMESNSLNNAFITT